MNGHFVFVRHFFVFMNFIRHFVFGRTNGARLFGVKQSIVLRKSSPNVVNNDKIMIPVNIRIYSDHYIVTHT